MLAYSRLHIIVTTEGSITLDGENIKNISMKELRDELGYVPQKEYYSFRKYY